MVRPRRLTADQDEDQDRTRPVPRLPAAEQSPPRPPHPRPAAEQSPPRLPRPIPAAYYARPAEPPPEPVRARTAVRDPRRRWMGLGLTGAAVTCAALLALLAHGLLSGPGGARPGSLLPARPEQAAGPAASDQPAATPVPARSPSSTPRPTPSATPRRPPAPPFVTLLNAPLSVHRGDSPTLQVRTTPQTTCTVDLGYPSAPQLGPATSDAGGSVSWTWRVTGRPLTGTWPFTVSCGGSSATSQITLS